MKDKIKKLELERNRIYKYWHNKMAFSMSDDYTKMMVGRDEYNKLGEKIKRLKRKINNVS